MNNREKNQKEKVLISVIVTTHNRLSLLQEALDSVYAQEGVGELFEMEVIVVDDTPSDASRKAMSRYPGIQYMPLEKSVFVSAARNLGIKTSHGGYVALLDDDDLWLPHRLRAHVPVIEKNPDAGVIYGQIIVKGDGPDTIWPDPRRAPSGAAFRDILLDEFMHPTFVMIRRDAFEKAGYFDENLRTMEHYDMFLRLAIHVPFAFVPGAVAVGRFSEGGKWFTNIKSGEYARVVNYVVDRALNMLPDTPERAEMRRQADSAWLSHFIYWLEKAEQPDKMRGYFLDALGKKTWMMKESWALSVAAENASRIAKKAALLSDSPIPTVRTFCAEIKASVGAHKIEEWLKLQWLMAYIWMAVGFAFRSMDRPLNRRIGGYAACYAAIHNPLQLTQKSFWRLLIRGILAGHRWDPFLAIFRKAKSE
jgi:GT2 family glycosyltransferase